MNLSTCSNSEAAYETHPDLLIICFIHGDPQGDLEPPLPRWLGWLYPGDLGLMGGGGLYPRAAGGGDLDEYLTGELYRGAARYACGGGARW